MKPEFDNQQSDWLSQASVLNNTEAAQVNGGATNARNLAMQADRNKQSFKLKLKYSKCFKNLFLPQLKA